MAWRTGPFAPDAGGLRSDCGSILQAALLAVDPERAVTAALQAHERTFRDAARVRVLAIGKAAPAMARAAIRTIGRVHDGLVVAPAALLADLPPPIAGQPGDHPIPGPNSRAAGQRISEFAAAGAADDIVLCLLSGGASALAVRPLPGLDIADIAATADLLLRAGVPIQGLNAVRRRLDLLKGGRLALSLAPAAIIALLVSDVPGDDPAVIGSGPVTPDETTWQTARDVLHDARIMDRVPAAVRAIVGAGVAGRVSDTPRPDDAGLPATTVQIVASVGMAVAAAARMATSLGYATDVADRVVTGEARAVGVRLATRLATDHGRRAIIQGGETTVTVTGDGRGGRNQEVALGAARVLADLPAGLVAAFGTDGVDGPTDAAGALATADTLRRARALGLDPDDALARNDAWSFFDALGDLIRTGPTGTNVMDVHVALATDGTA